MEYMSLRDNYMKVKRLSLIVMEYQLTLEGSLKDLREVS